MRKYFILFLLLITGVLWGYPPLPEPRSDDEALLIRRILDFWRDKEYPFAKSQIKNYLKNYPHSPCTDHFWAMLGDMAMKSEVYQDAADYYDKIEDPEIKVQVQLKKWQALYQMELYTQLYQEIAPSIVDLSEDEGCFYFAEAAFREALTLLRYPEGKQEAKSLCKEALPFYETLIENEVFSFHAKLAIAEIYRLLGEPEKAATFYLDLVEHDEKDEILFHAASVLLSCDKPRAQNLFERLAKNEGEKSSEATFQWFQLLAENEDWKTIAHERDLLTSHLEAHHLPTCYFYLGVISMEKQLFHQAVADFKKSIKKTLSPDHEQKAYLNLLVGGRELGNLELCETSYEAICTHFPKVKPEACMLLASAYHQSKEYGRALNLYERISHEFPNTDFAEQAAVEKVRLLVGGKRFDEAHEALLGFIETFPQSGKKTEMIRLAIDLSLTQLAEKEVYGQLAEDLERAFEAHAFHPAEMPKKQHLLAQAYLKLGRVHGALSLLHKMEDPDPLLLTNCYLKEGTSPENVITHGEEALSKYPDEKRLHLHLFNAYLDLAKEKNNQSFTHNAAEHLEQVVDIFPVSLENRLWLAHYFSDKEKERAIPILESLLQTDTNLKRFDKEALLLASHYHERGSLDQAHTLLKTLASLDQSSALAAQLKLADVCLDQNEVDQAKKLYQKLEDSAQLGIAYAAKLQLARLSFSDAPDKNLKKLRDLALRKNLANEPIHLEAALDYSELKASTYPEEEQATTLLQLFVQVKDAFTKQEDIWSKDYHASRELLPEKDLVYQAYMRYLDARILSLQAQIAKEGGNSSESKTKEHAARALYSTLKRGEHAVSNYINDKLMTRYVE